MNIYAHIKHHLFYKSLVQIVAAFYLAVFRSYSQFKSSLHLQLHWKTIRLRFALLLVLNSPDFALFLTEHSHNLVLLLTELHYHFALLLTEHC